MFKKSSQYQEQKENSVQFPCKKLIMMKILEHLYGGNLEVSGLNCSEIMELLDMLRYILLQEWFKILEQYLDNQIEAQKIPVKDCLDAAEMTFSLKLVNARFSIIDYITRNIDIVIRDHSEMISILSKEVVGMIISSSSFQELDQINHLKFVEKWFHTSGLKTSRRKKYLFWFRTCFFWAYFEGLHDLCYIFHICNFCITRHIKIRESWSIIHTWSLKSNNLKQS